MYMRELLIGTMLIAIGTAAGAQTASSTPEARTVAAPPAPVGDAAEPTPPSPGAGEPSEETGVPSVDGNFGLGRPATEEEIAAIDIDIMPDGTGLPEGRGTYQQGQELYAELCSVCHGDNLEGIKVTGAPALIGGRDTLATASPVKTVESYWPYASTLYDYIHRAMPMTEPGTLEPDQIYALSAYILGRGGIVAEDVEFDADSFRQIVMPNADGFIDDPRPGGM